MSWWIQKPSSNCIARAPGQVDVYAKGMADLARLIHGISSDEDDGFPDARDRLREYVSGGIACEDEALAEKCMKLINGLPQTNTLIHGDCHTGNVFLQKGEPLLIDMDRVSRGHPIIEISDLYYFYVVLGEDDPTVVEKFMGFSYDTARQFFHSFMGRYLGTEDENSIRHVTEKASIIAYSRLIRKLRKHGTVSAADRKIIGRCMNRIAELTEKLDSLVF